VFGIAILKMHNLKIEEKKKKKIISISKLEGIYLKKAS
jgi:hypothetical protein